MLIGPTQDYLHTRFNYDPDTGTLTWKELGLIKRESDALAAYEEHKTFAKAAKALGLTVGCFQGRIESARESLKTGIVSPNHLGKQIPYTQVGQIAGCLRPDGYISVRFDDVLYLAHRLIWIMVHGEPPRDELDHIDRNRANNRIENLREADSSQNKMNQKRRADNKSGVKGVYLRKDTQKWSAEIKAHRRKVCLGSYSTPQEAQAAYRGANRLLHKEFGRAE